MSLDRFIKSGSLGTRVNQNDKFGQLKVTIAKFYRVTGGTTQNRGVIPDIRFPSVYEMDFGESTELHALPWDEISPALFKPMDQVSPYIAKLRIKSQKRTAHDPEFQYLLEDIQHYKDSKSLTLNERKRKAERERLEAKRLRRINERRQRKGLKPLPKGAKIPSDEEAPDAFLRETERILADYISLSNPNGGTELAKTEKGRQATPEAKSQTAKVKEN
ncbi:MAG: hypothetical protein D6743_01440 [Calditrichaeota bacterium]|nr:MAG: hypothetical protein D6743_01440 [Calditrichota bacterium]